MSAAVRVISNEHIPPGASSAPCTINLGIPPDRSEKNSEPAPQDPAAGRLLRVNPFKTSSVNAMFSRVEELLVLVMVKRTIASSPGLITGSGFRVFASKNSLVKRGEF